MTGSFTTINQYEYLSQFFYKMTAIFGVDNGKIENVFLGLVHYLMFKI